MSVAYASNFMIRPYAPETGRFLSEDPIGFMSIDVNLYRYTSNQPLKYADPYGFKIVDVTDGSIPDCVKRSLVYRYADWLSAVQLVISINNNSNLFGMVGWFSQQAPNIQSMEINNRRHGGNGSGNSCSVSNRDELLDTYGDEFSHVFGNIFGTSEGFDHSFLKPVMNYLIGIS